MKKPLNKQIEKACADPFRAGEPMRHLPPHLQGYLYKLRIRGPRGFRMIYFIHREKSIVLGTYISQIKRKNFNYNKAPWLESANEIYDDYTTGNISKFKLIDPQEGIP